MSTIGSDSRELFDELKPGDRIEIRDTVTDGRQTRVRSTTGSVVRTECGRTGPHFHPGHQQAGPSDLILLELPDGELTTVAVSESTELRRA